MDNAYRQAIKILQTGGIIAYPTEAVFGLGCDPFNEKAVKKIIDLKQRSIEKGLILIAANWEQIEPLVQPTKNLWPKAFATWPGPTTWLFPASSKCPKWITGKYDSVALRITAHQEAKTICEHFGGPIVSTSANVEGEPPAKTKSELSAKLLTSIDFILPGTIGECQQPTTIVDLLTDKVIRS